MGGEGLCDLLGSPPSWAGIPSFIKGGCHNLTAWEEFHSTLWLLPVRKDIVHFPRPELILLQKLSHRKKGENLHNRQQGIAHLIHTRWGVARAQVPFSIRSGVCFGMGPWLAPVVPGKCKPLKLKCCESKYQDVWHCVNKNVDNWDVRFWFHSEY